MSCSVWKDTTILEDLTASIFRGEANDTGRRGIYKGLKCKSSAANRTGLAASKTSRRREA